jgi:hypothetical protein
MEPYKFIALEIDLVPVSGDMVIPNLRWLGACCPARPLKEPVERGLSRVGYARLRDQRVVHTGLRK